MLFEERVAEKRDVKSEMVNGTYHKLRTLYHTLEGATVDC